MNEIVQSYVSGKQFMGTVLVAQGDKILLDKGYGYANLEWQIPDAPEAKFRLGSITKQFTCAAVLVGILALSGVRIDGTSPAGAARETRGEQATETP